MQTAPLILAFALLLIVIIVFLLFLTSTISQILWRVPFVPTPKKVALAMLDMAQMNPGDRVADLGAGDGRLLILAKKLEPGISATGYEGTLGVWLLSKLRTSLAGRKVDMQCRNFFKQNLSEYDAIFAYLSPYAMAKLGEKFRNELKPGTRIISHAFSIPGIEPAEIRLVPHWLGKNTKVYGYVWEG